MKKILISLLLLVPFFCSAQTDSLEYKAEDGRAMFSKVITADGKSKDQLFNLAKEFIYHTYGSGDAVIQTENKEDGKLTCKGTSQELLYKNMGAKMNGGNFIYNFTIYCKDGKAKIVFSDIYHKGGQMAQMKDGSNYADAFPSTWGKFGKSQSAKEWVKMKEQAKAEFTVIAEGLAMKLTNTDKQADF